MKRRGIKEIGEDQRPVHLHVRNRARADGLRQHRDRLRLVMFVKAKGYAAMRGFGAGPRPMMPGNTGTNDAAPVSVAGDLQIEEKLY